MPPEVFEDVRQDASPVETLSLDALRRKRISQTQSLTSNYIRVYVWVSADLSIPCIIEKSTTVQTLAKTVEAEYFFRHGKTLSCCILTNDAWDPLHFDHKIGRRFEHESHFRVFDYTVGMHSLFSHF